VNLGSGWSGFFIHFDTKVCVANVENCFGECKMQGNDDSFKLPIIPRGGTSNGTVRFSDPLRQSYKLFGEKSKYWRKI